MKIGIDARLVAKGRGLGEFAYQLLVNLPKDSGDEYYVYSYPGYGWDMSMLPPKTIIREVPPSYVISEQIYLPWAIRRDRLDVFHATTNTAPIALPTKTRLVLTIHDAMFLTDKKRIPASTSIYQKVGRKYYAIISKKMINRAKQLVTISEFSKQDIAEGLDIAPDRLAVIYQGVGKEFAPSTDQNIQSVKSKYGIDENYILHLGAIDPRKQTKFVIKAFANLQREKAMAGKLVVTGLSDSQNAVFTNLAQSLGVGAKVIFVGFISKQDLVSLYGGAECLLFPTLYEGFGLPVLQAMACNCPVICSNTSSLPEVAQEAAYYIDPNSLDECQKALIAILTDEHLASQLVKKGALRATDYNWAHTSAQYQQIYHRV